MLDLHLPTCEFIVPFYHRAQRYINITASLLKQGVLDYNQAVCKIRTELYGLHNQIYQLLLPLERRIARFNTQIDLATEVFRILCTWPYLCFTLFGMILFSGGDSIICSVLGFNGMRSC